MTLFSRLFLQQQRLFTLPPDVQSKLFLYTFHKQIQHLYFDRNSHLICYYTLNSKIFEKVFLKLNPSVNHTRTRLFKRHLNFFVLLPI